MRFKACVHSLSVFYSQVKVTKRLQVGLVPGFICLLSSTCKVLEDCPSFLGFLICMASENCVMTHSPCSL